MKDRIIAALGNEKLEHVENITLSQFYVIDLTRRTNSAQSMKIYDKKPHGIDTLLVENPNLDITATFFKPQCFREERGGVEPNNCEGVFYLTDSTNATWVLFLEMKDCDATNISDYFRKSKKQITETVKIFRNKRIISYGKRVYANISFPRKHKMDFFNQLIKPGEMKSFIDNHNIFIRGTNKLRIKNNTTIF